MDADTLIAEIATRHGVAVSRDDPIMVLATLNELLAQDSAAAQKALLAHFKDEIEAASEKWTHEAQTRAQALLNRAVEASREAAAASARKESEDIAAALRREMQRLHAAEQHLRWMLAINALASLFAFSAACLGLLGWR